MVRKVKGFKYKENLIQYKATMNQRKEIEKEALDLMESIKKKEEEVLSFSCTSIEDPDRDKKIVRSFANLMTLSLANEKMPEILTRGIDPKDTEKILDAMMSELLTRSRNENN